MVSVSVFAHTHTHTVTNISEDFVVANVCDIDNKPINKIVKLSSLSPRAKLSFSFWGTQASSNNKPKKITTKRTVRKVAKSLNTLYS